MIDSNFKVYLIEINTNPCLEFSCLMLNRLLTNLVENVIRLELLFRIAIDPIFPPPSIEI